MRTIPTICFSDARTRLFALVALSGLAFGSQLACAGTGKIDARIRQSILDCTFEVLAQSPPRESDTRPFNPAPLVRVAGSAFCFGDDDELATAAHVFEPVLGGRFEVPFVRDRAGHTYRVEQIVRYSMPNDFVTFKVADLPTRAARPHNTSDDISDRLYLAWRERDGEIVFDSTRYRGRSTRATFGRDGWIQFGPAPGHGASGAALFDDQGRVVGLINNRSSESADALGYAVPVQRIEAASTQWAEIAQHDPMRVLGMPSERNQPLIGGIPLPAPYARFDQHMTDVRRTYFAHMLPYSLSLAGIDAPLSDTQRASLCAALGPEYCVQAAQGSTTPARAIRHGRGCEVVWNGIGAALVHCNARDVAAISPEDARTRLAALAVGERFVQAPPPPCTSEDGLDPTAAVDSFIDHTGAQWHVQSSLARGCDWMVISMARPLAGGMLMFVRGAPTAYADAALMQLKTLTSIERDGDRSGNGEIKDAVLAEAGARSVTRAAR